MTHHQLSFNKRAVSALTLILVFTINGARAVAQEQTPTQPPAPKSPEALRKEAAEAAKAEADARKAAADASKAELDLKFPPPTSTPLAGTTTVNDTAIIESMMIAYISMAKAANRLVGTVSNFKNQQNLNIKNLAIFNERDINLLLSYKVVRVQVEIIKQGYCSLLTPNAAVDPVTGDALCPTLSTAAAPVAPVLSVARSFLGGFVDLTAFLRTNVEIKGHTFDIDEAPLVAEVFRAARKDDRLKEVSLYYPHVFSPDQNDALQSELLKQLQDVRNLRAAAENLIGNIVKTGGEVQESEATAKQIEKAIGDLKKKGQEAFPAAKNLIRANCPNIVVVESNVVKVIENIIDGRACPKMSVSDRERLLNARDTLIETPSRIADAEKKLAEEKAKAERLKKDLEELKKNLRPSIKDKADLDAAIAQLKSFNDQFDKLVGGLVQADAATGINPLTSYIRVENLKAALPSDSYWLQLRVLKAGGNNRIKTNLIIDIFTGGNRLSHSGGAIIQYNLYDQHGESKLSDTITEYTDYIKAGKIKNLPNLTVDDCVEKGGNLDCVNWPRRTP